VLSRLPLLVIQWLTSAERSYQRAKATDMEFSQSMMEAVSYLPLCGVIAIEGTLFQLVPLLRLDMLLNEHDGNKLIILLMLSQRGRTLLSLNPRLVNNTTQLAAILIDTIEAGNPI